jgi:hypothetical protein
MRVDPAVGEILDALATHRYTEADQCIAELLSSGVRLAECIHRPLRRITTTVASEFVEDPGAHVEAPIMEPGQDFADVGIVWLPEYTEMDDEAAEILAGCKDSLLLRGLKSISDEAADTLSKHRYPIHHHGYGEWAGRSNCLDLSGVEFLSDVAAQSLAGYKGILCLDGLTSLSDAAAQSFAEFGGEWLKLGGLLSLSDTAVLALSKNERIRLPDKFKR